MNASSSCPTRNETFFNAAVGVRPAKHINSITSNPLNTTSLGTCGSVDDQVTFATHVSFNSSLVKLGEQIDVIWFETSPVTMSVLSERRVGFQIKTYDSGEGAWVVVSRYNGGSASLISNYIDLIDVINDASCVSLFRALHYAIYTEQTKMNYFMSVSIKAMNVGSVDPSTGSTYRERYIYFFANYRTNETFTCEFMARFNPVGICLIPLPNYVLRVGTSSLFLEGIRSSFPGEIAKLEIFDTALNTTQMMSLFRKGKQNSIMVAASTWTIFSPVGGGLLDLSSILVYDEDLDPWRQIKVMSSPSNGTLFLFGRKLDPGMVIYANQSNGLRYVPHHISLLETPSCSYSDADSFSIRVTDHVCDTDECYVGNPTTAFVCFKPSVQTNVSLAKEGGVINATIPFTAIKILPLTTFGSLFLFGTRLTNETIIFQNQTYGLTYVPFNIPSVSDKEGESCETRFDSFAIYPTTLPCVDDACFLNGIYEVVICLYQPYSIWIEVSQGSIQSISLPFPRFLLSRLPSKGQLLMTNTSAPIASSALMNETFRNTELSFDIQNRTVFSWALSGECRGEYTSFGIYVDDVFRDVRICIRNIIDPPRVLPVDLGDITIDDFRVVRLDVLSSEDFLVDAMGNPSPFRTRLNQAAFIPSASIRFTGIVENDLFYLTSVVTPTRCGNTKINSFLTPTLFGGEEVFLVCLHLKPTAVVETNLKPRANITFLYIDENGASLEQNITFRAVVPYVSKNFEFIFTESPNAAHNITLAEPNQVTQFKIHSLPLHGTLLFPNNSVVELGSVFAGQLIYSPNPYYYNKIIGETGDPDLFSFSVGGVPFNSNYSSPTYRCNIYIESRPSISPDQNLALPQYVHLLRGETTPLFRDMSWISLDDTLYTMRASLSLIENVAGALVFGSLDQVNMVEQSEVGLVIFGNPVEVFRVLGSVGVFLAETQTLKNATQKVDVSITYPYFNLTDHEDGLVGCGKITFTAEPESLQARVFGLVDIINSVLLAWSALMTFFILRTLYMCFRTDERGVSPDPNIASSQKKTGMPKGRA